MSRNHRKGRFQPPEGLLDLYSLEEDEEDGVRLW